MMWSVWFLLCSVLSVGNSDQPETSCKNLTSERDQLLSSNEDLTRERDQLETSYKNLTRETDQLQTTLNTLMKERDDLQKRRCETNDGWTKFGCSWYHISTDMRSWVGSKYDCEFRGAHLVVINSKEEQEFLFTFKKRAWIGLSDRAVEGNWTWMDGTPLTTAFWYEGEPNNNDVGRPEGEDCAVMAVSSSKIMNRWIDWRCDDRIHWICERGI